MNNLFLHIENHKWPVLGTALIHVIWFFTFNFTYISRPSFPEEPVVEITMPLEQIEFEDLSMQEVDEEGNIIRSGEIKNMVLNQADEREKSMDNFSREKLDEQVKDELKDLERQTFEQLRAERENSGGNDGIGDYSEEEAMMNVTDEELEEMAKKTLNKKDPGGGSNKAYAGRTMVSFDIPGREPFNNEMKYVKNPGYTCAGSGTVVVRVKLDIEGRVIQAKYAPELSYRPTKCMVDQAEKYAEMSRFNHDTQRGGQTGTITYEFLAQ